MKTQRDEKHSEQLSVKIPYSLNERLSKHCEQQNLEKSSEVRLALDQYLRASEPNDYVDE